MKRFIMAGMILSAVLSILVGLATVSDQTAAGSNAKSAGIADWQQP